MTDANLVLGRIDPTLGGKFTLDREAAETAIRSVAEPLDMSVLECAEGITRIVSESMAMAIRSVSTDRGRDPRDQVMAAFGGAGGLHAAQIAASVGIERVLVTPYAGVACAFGAITMDVRHDLESTYFAPLSELDPADLSQAYADLEDQVRDLLEADGVPRAQAEVERSGQMRYVGQSYDVTTPVLGGELTESAVESMKRDFNQVHQREYGVSSESFEVALVTIRVTGRGRDQDLGRDALAEALSTDVAAGQSREPRARDVYFDGTHHQVDVYQLEDLKTDQKLQGPTVIEQPDGVIVVPPDSQASVDRYHNVLISSNQ